MRWRPVAFLATVSLCLAAAGLVTATIFSAEETTGIRTPNAAVTFSPSVSTVHPNEAFTLNIRVAPGGNALSVADVTIRFDPAVLTLLTLTNGGDFPNVLRSGVIRPDGTATIRLGTADGQPIRSAATIGTLSFRARAETQVPTTVEMVPDATFLGNQNAAMNLFARASAATVAVRPEDVVH